MSKKMNLAPYHNATKYMAAVNDPTGLYRYSLIRKWGNSKILVFILLNPSTATAEVDDPTIERCIDYAIKWGYNNIEVVNLFAIRLTDSDALTEVNTPLIGKENNYYIKRAIKRADKVVLAWGEKGVVKESGKKVLEMLHKYFVSKEMFCLNILKGGHPQHPLYVKSTAKPVVYPIKEQLKTLQ
ncbi:DUF1643 domain-containing protein [Peribacillus loiseleuriae]|uniref:DUF1643 domain-containing protein n=1 Tax=Peribacillus loiseleuriae TaxID=1679170 RepID=UPI0037F64009